MHRFTYVESIRFPMCKIFYRLGVNMLTGKVKNEAFYRCSKAPASGLGIAGQVCSENCLNGAAYLTLRIGNRSLRCLTFCIPDI